MVFLVFFSLAGVVIVALILLFDKKQTKRVNNILKETRSIPPLFMLKSTEQKISALKSALRYDDVPQNMAATASVASIYNSQSDNKRLSKIQELKQLSAKYNNGQISLEAYNVKLDELLQQVRSRSGSVELVIG